MYLKYMIFCEYLTIHRIYYLKMAIKYSIKTGSELHNQKARGQRDGIYKPALRGMSCSKCKEDTIIEFSIFDGYVGSGSVDSRIWACCKDFENRIRERLS